MNPNKPVTIKLNKDFRTAYYHGGSQVHPALVTYVRKNRLGVTRVGITTGKKIGSAVARNRCRRVKLTGPFPQNSGKAMTSCLSRGCAPRR